MVSVTVIVVLSCQSPLSSAVINCCDLSSAIISCYPLSWIIISCHHCHHPPHNLLVIFIFFVVLVSALPFLELFLFLDLHFVPLEMYQFGHSGPFRTIYMRLMVDVTNISCACKILAVSMRCNQTCAKFFCYQDIRYQIAFIRISRDLSGLTPRCHITSKYTAQS